MRVGSFSNGFWWGIGACVLCALAVVFRLPLLHHAFSLDDFHLIVTNDFISRWQNISILCDPRYLLHPYPLRCGARPFTVLSLMLDHRIWGGAPFGYHLTNIMLHALNTVWVFVIAGLAGISVPGARMRRLWVAGVAALLFSLHPLQTEVVATASFRGDLLSAGFFLCAVAAMMGGMRTRQPHQLFMFLGVILCVGCAVLSKESAVTLPLLLGVVAVTELRDRPVPGYVWGICGGGIAVSLVYVGVFWWPRVIYALGDSVFPALIGARTPFDSFGAYVNTVTGTWLHYWERIVAPVHLSVDYQLAVPLHILPGRLFAAAGIAAALGSVTVWMRNKAVYIGAAWFLITYLPVSNCIPLTNTVNDRYLYLPLAGLAVMSAGLFGCLAERARAAAGGIACLLCGASLCLTVARQPVFVDNYALYAEAVRRAPQNARVRYNRAISLMIHDDYAGALREFATVPLLNPLYKRSEIWRLMGDCYRETGHRQRAESYYRKSLMIRPLTL